MKDSKVISTITAYQMRWSAQHDWYSHAGITQAGTYDIYCVDSAGNEVVFGNFEEMLNWAGY